MKFNSYSYWVPKMYKNYDLAHTKSDDFNVHVLMYTRLLKTYCIIKLFSFFSPGRTTGIQQTTKADRDCDDRPVIKVSKGMNLKKRKQRSTTTKQAIIQK